MKSALAPLQAALYSRLTNDAAITARVTSIFDAVPQGQTFPYIVLSNDTSADDSTKTYDQEDITKTIDVWSRYNGKKEAQEIMSLALESITREPLMLTGGFTAQFARLELMETLIDEDGVTRHGVLRLRFKIKQ